jgi:hypothetical protein
MKKFVTEQERKLIREDVEKALKDGSCQTRYEIAVMNVVIRLLDTIDNFVEANYKLAQRNTDLELAVIEDQENEKKLPIDMEFNLVWDNLTAHNDRLDAIVRRIDKLEARITKKKLVKKTTLKPKKK